MDYPKMMEIQAGVDTVLGQFMLGIDAPFLEKPISLYDIRDQLTRLDRRMADHHDEQMKALLDIYQELMYNRERLAVIEDRLRPWYSRLWRFTRSTFRHVAHWLGEDVPHEP